MSTEGLSAAHDSTVQPLKPEQRFSTFQPLMKMIIAFFQTSHRLPTGSFSRFSPFTLPYVVNVTRNTLSSLILKLLCLDASCAFKVVIVALASLLFPNRHHFLSDLCGCVNLAMISTILSSKSCKKSKSKSGSKLQSAASTPGQDGHNVNFTPEELSKKLSDLKQKQQEPYVDRSKSNVCEKFVDGKCPHGISGKKLLNGSACVKSHPKWCYRYARNGTHKKYGCKKGSKCTFYHPKHCPSSVADKTCFSEDCTLVHLVGTKRRKSQVEQKRTYR